jgi:hypothetical protein
MRGHSAWTYCELRCKLARSKPLSPGPSPRSGARGARLWARISATRRWAAGLPYSVDRRSQPHPQLPSVGQTSAPNEVSELRSVFTTDARSRFGAEVISTDASYEIPFELAVDATDCR